MRIKRWFFGAGAALGAVAVYQIVTRRKPQLAKAPSISTTARTAYAPSAPPAPKATAPDPAASTAATAPVTSAADLRGVVTDTISHEDTTTTPVAAAMATAVAEAAPPATAPAVAPTTLTRVIGNTHKMVYHLENDAHLPIEENRAYFASEQEAIDAGYRKAEPIV